MAAFDDVRAQYPGWSDLDIVKDIAATNDTTPDVVAGYYGVLKPKKQNSGLGGDIVTSLKRGAEGIPGMVTGLMDLPVALAGGGRPVSTAADWAGQKTGFRPGQWAKDAEQEYSQGYRSGQDEIQQTWDDKNSTVPEQALAYLTHPGYTLNQVAESVPSMLAGGVMSRGLMGVGSAAAKEAAPAVEGYMARRFGDNAAALAGGAGEGAVQAGQQMDQYQGDDQQKNAIAALGSGAIDAAIGFGGGRLAQKLGFSDIQVAMAGGKPADLLKPMGFAKRVAGGVVEEGLLQETPQSAQEQMWSNYADGKPLMEGVVRQAVEGGISGAVMGGGFNAMKRGGHGPVDLLDTTRDETTQPPAISGLLPNYAQPTMYTHADGSTSVGDPTAGFNMANAWKDIMARTAAAKTTQDATNKEDATNIGQPLNLADPNALPLPKTPGEAVALIDWAAGPDSAKHPVTEGSPLHDALLAAHDVLKANGLTYTAAKQQETAPADNTDALAAAKAQYGITRNLKFVNNAVLSVIDHTSAGRLTTEQAHGLMEQIAEASSLPYKQANKMLSGVADDINSAFSDQKGQNNGIVRQSVPEIGGAQGIQGQNPGGNQTQVVQDPNAQNNQGQTGQVTPLDVGTPEGRNALKLKVGAALTPQEKASVEGRLGGKFAGEMTADRIVALHKLLTADAVQKNGGEPLDPVQARKVEKQLAALTKEDDSGDEGAGASLRAAAAELTNGRHTAFPNGVSHETVRKHVNGALAKIETLAARHGLSLDQAHEALGLKADAVSNHMNTISEAEAAQLGLTYRRTGPKVSTDYAGSTNDDFDHSFGLSRDETTSTGEESDAAEVAKQDEAPVEGYDRAAEEEAPVEEAADDTPSTPTNTIENLISGFRDRIAAIKDKLGEKQTAGVDRIINRAADALEETRTPQERDPILEKLDGQVATYEDQAEKGIQYSKGGATAGTDATVVRTTMRKWFFSDDRMNKKVTVVQAYDELPPDIKQSVGEDANTQAFVKDGHAYMIADNIPAGAELAVLLHEVGVHLGMKNLIGAHNFKRLMSQISRWTAGNPKSIETQIARKAMDRAAAAAEASEKRGEAEQAPSEFGEELIAYFVEEAVNAGIDPTALDKIKGPLQAWFKTLMDAVRIALRKFGLDRIDTLTAQDIVNLAYGAANEEINSEPSSGTTSDVKFSAASINSRLLSWVKAVVAGTTKDSGAALIPSPTTFLKSIGIYRPVILDLGHVRHILNTHAEVSSEDIAALPDLLNRPRAVLKDGAGYLFIVDARDADGKPLIVSLQPGNVTDGPKTLKVTAVKTLFAKDDSAAYLTQELLAGNVKYMPEKETARLQDLWAAKSADALQSSEVLQSRPSSDDTKGQKPLPTPLLTERSVNIQTENGTVKLAIPAGAETRGSDVKFSMRAPTKSSIKELTDTLPDSIRPQAFVIATNIADTFKKGIRYFAFGHDLADMVSKNLSTAKAYFDLAGQRGATKMHLESQIEEIMQRSANVKDKAALNAFIKDSTSQQAWGFAPEWRKDAEVHSGMEAKFKALSPEAQATAKEIFKYGAENMQKLRDLVKAEIEETYADEPDITENERKKREQRKLRELRLFDKRFSEMQGPYAPLMRFGTHIISAKSQAYLDMEKSGDKAALENMQADGKHYVVEFADSLGEAKLRAEQLKNEGFAYADGFQKEAFYNGIQETPWSAMKRLKTMVDEEFRDGDAQGKKAVAQINSMLNDLYFSTLAESSARQFQNKRRNVEGASGDMLRAFASKGKADAHFIASLEHSGDVTRSISEMRKESLLADEHRADRVRDLNEILARHAQSLTYRPTPWQDKIAAVASGWMLVTNPAYYLQNSTQPFMMTVPWLAGRYGYAKSWGAMQRAYRDLAGGKLSIETMFKKGIITKGELDMLHQLKDNGILDIGINSDLGHWTKDQGQNPVLRGALGVNQKLQHAVQQLEVVNRVTSALAAHRLAGGGETGVKAATQAVRVTHGDYSGFNAPRLFGIPGAKLLLQFRKFQIIQLSMLARLVHNSFNGASAEEKAVARKALAFTLAHHGVMAGAMGLPAINLIAPIVAAALGGGGDDPGDEEYLLRKWIGDDDMADLLLKGVPARLGLDVSNRIGMGNATTLLPFANGDPLTTKGFMDYVMNAAGPAAGLGKKFVTGAELVKQGDLYKGMEQWLPSGFANAAKAYRFDTQGVTLKNNDVVIQPDEITAATAVLQALGLPTSQLTERQRRQGNLIEFEQHFKARTNEIEHRYAKAYRDGDGATLSSLREDWAALQTTKGEYGFKREPLSTLLKVPQGQAKRERAEIGGVQYKSNNRKFVASLAE